MSSKVKPPVSKYPQGTCCAYCTKKVPILEIEHVFPDSWYQDRTPRTEMMLVPACRACNGFYSRMDNDGRVLVLACEPDDPLTESVQKRVWRSMDPDAAKTSADKRARRARLKKLKAMRTVVTDGDLRRALWTADQPITRVSHQTESGVWLRGRPAMKMPPSLQPIVVGKWMRGSYYFLTGRPLAPFVRWSWFSPTAASNPGNMVRLCAERMPVVFDRPEFRVWGTPTIGDGATSIWMFVLWNKMVFFATSGELAEKNAQDIVLSAIG